MFALSTLGADDVAIEAQTYPYKGSSSVLSFASIRYYETNPVGYLCVFNNSPAG